MWESGRPSPSPPRLLGPQEGKGPPGCSNSLFECGPSSCCGPGGSFLGIRQSLPLPSPSTGPPLVPLSSWSKPAFSHLTASAFLIHSPGTVRPRSAHGRLLLISAHHHLLREASLNRSTQLAAPTSGTRLLSYQPICFPQGTSHRLKLSGVVLLRVYLAGVSVIQHRVRRGEAGSPDLA